MERVGKKQPGMLYPDYLGYLMSPEWIYKRKIFLDLKPTCVECGYKSQVPHHKHYNSVTNETFKDLMALCHHCHQIKHKEALDNDTRTTKNRRIKVYKG